MDGGPNEKALDRIEQALARIEAAASARPAGCGTGDAELEARHARLREAVAISIRRLDGLIGDIGL